MHCCCLGTFKSLFLKLFVTSNFQKPYYIGRNLVDLDKKFLNISLPKEFGRGIRSIYDRHHYKANELRTLAMYIAYGFLRDILPERYTRLFLCYSIFLRLLCQEAISNEDIQDAQILIETFSIEYQKLFSKEEMTFNLHMHLHLANQVKCFGSLCGTSCFPFENLFQATRDMFHGTQNFEGQIARNFAIRKQVIVSYDALRKKTENSDVDFFIKDQVYTKSFGKEDMLLKPVTITLGELKSFEAELLEASFGNISSIIQAQRAFFKNSGQSILIITFILVKNG